MAVIDLTAAQVNAAISTTATETFQKIVVAPTLDNVPTFALYRSDANANPPNAWHAVIAWPDRDPVDVLITDCIPVGDRAAFRVALGRLVLQARAQVGAV